MRNESVCVSVYKYIFNTTTTFFQFIHKNEEEKFIHKERRRRKENVMIESLVREIPGKKFKKIA